MKQRGQGQVEYALIILFIALVVIVLLTAPGVFVHSSLRSVVTEFP